MKSCFNDISELEEYAFSGIHIINIEFIKDLKEEKLSITPFYIEKSCNSKIIGYKHDKDFWIDCGKIESLKIAEKLVDN